MFPNTHNFFYRLSAGTRAVYKTSRTDWSSPTAQTAASRTMSSSSNLLTSMCLEILLSLDPRSAHLHQSELFQVSSFTWTDMRSSNCHRWWPLDFAVLCTVLLKGYLFDMAIVLVSTKKDLFLVLHIHPRIRMLVFLPCLKVAVMQQREFQILSSCKTFLL